jgi:uncharacterized protein YbcI
MSWFVHSFRGAHAPWNKPLRKQARESMGFRAVYGTSDAWTTGKLHKENNRPRGPTVVYATGRTIGELEAEISQAAIRFEKEFMGRGPLETKTFLLDDLVVIQLKGVLTQSEIKLAEANDRQRGRYLLKQVRQELIDHARPMLECLIRDILGVNVRSLHTDISTKTGERVIVLSLEKRPPVTSSPKNTNAHARDRGDECCTNNK